METYDEEQKSYYMEQRATVRIKFRDGTFIDAEGKGISAGSSHKAVSFSNSKKMAVANGLHNAIMLFVDLLDEK